MYIKTLKESGFDEAMYGMRAPLKSYAKSDTEDGQAGGNDTSLGMRLAKSGATHRKWMRQVMIWAEIEAPRYWWSEFDTYKVGTSANSESTMHTLQRDVVSDEMFDFDFANAPAEAVDAMRAVQCALTSLQLKYKDSTDADEKCYYKRVMKQLLPESFLQKRYVCMSYETVAHMYATRKGHKLTEWRETFCDWVKTLEHSDFIIAAANSDEQEN